MDFLDFDQIALPLWNAFDRHLHLKTTNKLESWKPPKKEQNWGIQRTKLGIYFRLDIGGIPQEEAPNNREKIRDKTV